MFVKRFVVTWMAGTASAALPAFSQSENPVVKSGLAGADRITHRAESSLGFGYRF